MKHDSLHRGNHGSHFSGGARQVKKALESSVAPDCDQAQVVVCGQIRWIAPKRETGSFALKLPAQAQGRAGET